ncbi:methionyl-tRNA formyltransferase [Amylibacter sp.]|jgi:methionyl-tRNA formyltransferase|nr:methionyl-tRNA formyltransferase [Rhodobacterales bacterium]MCO4796662.1 methionyl-tRNA formyltransferase [Amylibacter sp.]MBT4133736.1 methionyl-tRNA formyltransferase [Rhodobacterales bacterium]MBT6895108.1 methionyl-tRNA formyltransferase [Rhodobacterales bacterium]MBT7560020.1 methionyl-tRNA formyltransferase [Rhodobacterales bacterium]
MRIIFMGSPEFSVPILSSIISAGHDVVAVYCQPPRPAGRGKKERLTPVHSRALELGLDVRHPVNFKSKEAVSDFAALKADIAVVVAYGLILPQEILDSVDKGCLNIHASLLPRWRGAAPIHRAIISGDASTGICIMQMDAGLDTGDVLYHKETEILPSDTTAVLHDRLARIGSQCIVDVLKKYAFLEAVPQSDIGIIYASKIDKNESKIDWNKSAIEIDRQIRGLSPFPGAWFDDGEQRVKVLMSEVVEGSGFPGEILDHATIACQSGALKLTRLQRAGKGAMDIKNFLLGYNFPNKKLN